jgi:methylated-DNA-[protein]-cysteine S-methyltransferase
MFKSSPEKYRVMSDAEEGIYALESGFLESAVQVGVASSRVISVSFPQTPDEEAQDAYPLLDRIRRYLDGTEVDLSDVEVALTVPTDQRSVLEAVRGIPYGKQVSVKELAAMSSGIDPEDDDDLDLVVRTALDENPVPLVVPDHRIRDGPSGAPPSIEQRLRSIEGL